MSVEISAQTVKELREKTSAGMMDCKKALQEANGDIEKAMETLRQKGLASANKKSSRIATEGVIESYIHMGGKLGVIVEVNCETDFVAKTDNFRNGLEAILNSIHSTKSLDASLDQSQLEKLKSIQNEVKLLTSLDPEVKS